MAGALNTGDQGDQGDQGDAPAKRKDEFSWAAIGVPLVALLATVPLVARMVSDGCP